jgi:DNA-binding beta-propeller fold protein YncE
MTRAPIALVWTALLAATVHPGAGITVGRDGLIYFADPANNIVWRLDDDGSLSKIVEDVHTNVLLIADDGTPYFPQGGYPPEQLAYLTEAPDGTGYGTIRSLVIRIGADGYFETVAGDTIRGFRDGPAAQALFNRPQGIAVDSAGAIYVADHGNRRLRRINTDGIVETVARPGWPWVPTGVAIRGEEVFVLERLGSYWGLLGPALALRRLMDHPRVSVIRDGSIEVVAAVPTEKEPARTMIIGVLVIALVTGGLLIYGRFADRKLKSHTST